jgi:hypothetical protein
MIVKFFSVLVLCTQVNMMFVMLLWVYTIHTGQAEAWKICGRPRWESNLLYDLIVKLRNKKVNIQYYIEARESKS